jgi:hypothetical protein
MSTSINDIEAAVMNALAGLFPTVEEKDEKNDNPLVWIGEKVVERPDGGAFVNRDYMTKADMQQKVMSQGAMRIPSYYSLAGKLVKSDFMTKSSAKYPGGVAGGLSNAIDVYTAYTADGGTLNFTQWLDWYSSGGTGGEDDGGKYTGPRSTITFASERDLRTTADTVASEVLGRGITDEEFKKVLDKVRKAEQAEPTVTTPGTATTISQSGLSAQGRQDIITNALMKGTEAEDFGKATKMMDLFYSALEARPEGA